jgi:hypothetical protein
VKRVFEREVGETLVLILADGERIETTANHPFYIEGRGFVPAGHLGIGTLIVTRAGPSLKVVKAERKVGRTKVYNLEVEDFHTYFVGKGEGGIWVHNQCTFYHGTDVDSALSFLNGGELDAAAAAAGKVEAGTPAAFFLATDYDAAAYMALRRAPGAVLKYEFTEDALSQIKGAGSIQQAIPFGGKVAPPGEELLIPESAFGLFNNLRAAGKIRVTPAR